MRENVRILYREKNTHEGTSDKKIYKDRLKN